LPGITETEVTTVITSHDLLPKFKTLLDKCPLVKTIIYIEDQLQKTETTGFKEGVKILPFNQVVKTGQDSKFGTFWKGLKRWFIYVNYTINLLKCIVFHTENGVGSTCSPSALSSGARAVAIDVDATGFCASLSSTTLLILSRLSMSSLSVDLFSLSEPCANSASGKWLQ